MQDNLLGRYAFTVPRLSAASELWPLRNPAGALEDLRVKKRQDRILLNGLIQPFQ